MSRLQSHARPLGAALLILVVGLGAGLFVTHFPTDAGTGGTQAGAIPAGAQAFQDYRAGERGDLVPTSQQAAQPNADNRSGERQGPIHNVTTPEAWQQYRAGERVNLP